MVPLPPKASDEEVEKVMSESAKHQRALYQDLRERGLLPRQRENLGAMDVNEFLLSGGMEDAEPKPRRGD
jgi:hypothetical protein